MTKKLIAPILLLTAYTAYTQKNIDGLVNAERSFAGYAVKNGVKAAFLKFADSNAVEFDHGKPVNSMQSWTSKTERGGILNWHPQFAEIASSNDLGYTTGPWTFQPKTLQDSVMARGQYNTVWHMDKNGNWKFLVDLGVSPTPVNNAKEVQKIKANKFVKTAGDQESLLKAEEAFVKSYQNSKGVAYRQYLSYKSILTRNKSLPATTSKDRFDIIALTPEGIEFSLIGSGMASSGDLGYVYGTAALNGKQENFLRVWRKEKNGWKIALEVLRY